MGSKDLYFEDTKYLIDKYSNIELFKSTRLDLKRLLENFRFELLRAAQVDQAIRFQVFLNECFSEKSFQELISEMIAQNFLKKDDILFIFDMIRGFPKSVFHDHKSYVALFDAAIQKEIITKKDLIDHMKSIGALASFLHFKNILIHELFDANLLTVEDLKYALSKITDRSELSQLKENRQFIRLLIRNNLFHECVDVFKNISSYTQNCLYLLLEHPKFFQSYFFQPTEQALNSLKYVFDSITTTKELFNLCFKNVFLIESLLKSNTISLREVIDKVLTLQGYDLDNLSELRLLLREDVLSKDLLESQCISAQDLKYLFDEIVKETKKSKYSYGFENLSRNTFLIFQMILLDVVPFQKLLISYDEQKLFFRILENSELFELLFSSRLISTEDIDKALNMIHTYNDLRKLSENKCLTEYVLENFLIDSSKAAQFDKVHNEYFSDSTLQSCKKLIIFQYFQSEYEHKKNSKILELIELNQLFLKFNLNAYQKKDIFEQLFKNTKNDQALNRLRAIVEAQIEDTYDFESLMIYLNKKEKKNLINI